MARFSKKEVRDAQSNYDEGIQKGAFATFFGSLALRQESKQRVFKNARFGTKKSTAVRQAMRYTAN